MNIGYLTKISSASLILSIFLISSCNDEERISAQDTQDISEESVTDSYFQDVDDMAGVAIATPDDDEYGGRANTHGEFDDLRFKCVGANITLTRASDSSPALPKGSIVVDFGAACTDQRGNIRSGKLTFTYSGRRHQVGSSVVITMDDYKINGIKLEGTKTMTHIEGGTLLAPRYHIVLENGMATFQDGAIAERNSDITMQVGSGEVLIDETSTANGKTRGGRSYVLTLDQELIYKRNCGIAVSGIKRYVINGNREIIIDYGDGTCDKSIVITVDGVTRKVSVD
jgi:hypothetical protein